MKLQNLFENDNSVGQLSINGKSVLLNGKIRKTWNGHFNCSRKNLKTLIGCPTKVTGYFDCSDNPALQSLEGSPIEVGDEFSCSDSGIVSLVGGPSKVGTFYSCGGNYIQSLEGMPADFEGNLFCSHNYLQTLKGAPRKVKYLNCSHNNITSLEFAPSIIDGDFVCSSNGLSSLRNISVYIKEINGVADFSKNEITSNVLGLLKIKGLKQVKLENQRVEEIINKHLKDSDPDLFDCQDELVNYGFVEFAKL